MTKYAPRSSGLRRTQELLLKNQCLPDISDRFGQESCFHGCSRVSEPMRGIKNELSTVTTLPVQ